MNKLILTLFVVAIVGCSTNRYVLTDNNTDRKYLKEYINKLAKEGEISNKPLVVVDGLAYSYRYLKTEKLQINKADINKIEVLPKNNEKAIKIFGEKGRNGTLLISTNKAQEKVAKTISDGKILYLIGDRPITQEELKTISPNDIDAIKVIKDRLEVSKYASDEYDGVVIITLKKKPEVIQEKASKTISDSKVLYLIGDRPITPEEFKTINPDDIDSIKIIKDRLELSKYASDKYDGVVIVTLKKKPEVK